MTRTERILCVSSWTIRVLFRGSYTNKLACNNPLDFAANFGNRILASEASRRREVENLAKRFHLAT
jgi:hypothetical protein